MRSIVPVFILIFFSTALFAQNGEMNGDVVNASKVRLIDFDVLLKSDGQVIRNVYSTDGYFSFKSIPPGKYSIEVIYNGESRSWNLALDPGETRILHLEFLGVEERPEITVRNLKPDQQPCTDCTPPPIPDPVKIISVDPVITQTRNGYSFGGSRPDGTANIKDGLRWIGPTPLVGLDLLAIDAVWSGVPVRYGDFTGGAARFTTVTPTLRKRKSFEGYSSSPFNPYHHNRFHTFMTGPLITREIEGDSNSRINKRMILGYNLSTFLIYQKDPNPGFTGVTRLDDASLEAIEKNPLTSGDQMNSFVPAASFVNEDQLHRTKARNHAGYTDAAADLKLHFAPTPYLSFDFSNNYRYTKSRLYSFNNSLLNEARNPFRIENNYAGYVTVNHTLKSPYTYDGKSRQDSSDLFSDLMYSVQIDYQTRTVNTMDPTHHDHIFDYGYIGRTNTKRSPVYSYVENTPKVVTDQYGNEVVITNYHELTGYEDTALIFNSGKANPILARYNELVYDEYGNIRNENELVERGGLLNGQSPTNVYSLFNNVGTITSNYSKVQNERFGLTAFTEATFHPNRDPLVKHDLQFGIQYEQYSQSYYSLNAAGLWRLMPLLANTHIEDIDRNKAILSYDEKGRFTDTLRYDASADLASQRHFDRSLRNKLISEGYRDANGNPIGETSIIDVNSLDPSVFSIDMFSADELLNNGNGYVAYSGYDYKGNRRRGRKDIQDFLNDPLNRPMDSYSPILSAAWIQDKFQIQDIIMRAGVRFEQFDANQYTLADPYSLFPVKTVAEAKHDHPGLSIAGNVGDDYKVYVDNAGSPGKITGYRNGDQWFDANGLAISNPEVIATQSSRGAVQPLLVDPNQSKIDRNSFREYKPVLNVLPRLAFYFPMNTQAMFYANYDQLAQRPPDAQTFVPLATYYNFQANASSILPNAALKPRVKTDYLVGFKQLVGDHGMINMSVNYATIRNDFNQVRIAQAYPYSYSTYANIDFSTVKSFKVSYQHESDHVDFVLGYNLQYADGTGSNINSAQTLIQSGQPNLRSLYPLSFDVRHSIKGNLSIYANPRKKGAMARVKEKQPATRWEKISDKSFVSITGRAYSGVPYTSITQAVSEAQASQGLVQRSQVKGNPFGSRMPWKIYIDARIEKSFVLKSDMILNQRVPRKTLDVFLVADNLLNLKVIENVYRYTGRPDDDGYLNSPVGQQQAQNQLDVATFQALYDLKLQNPLNFYNPRMVQIGFRFNFI